MYYLVMAKQPDSHAIRISAEDLKIIASIRKKLEPIDGPLTIPAIWRKAIRALDGSKK